MYLIHSKEIRSGEWDWIDPKYVEKGPVLSPMMCDNKAKILGATMRLFQVGLSSVPQNRDSAIVGVIYELLDFCAGHRINVEQQLTRLINENED